ncbi:hypothetical protein CPB84DRAFT_1853051 [Gymnopilus junonius]|uniref:Uncharacterized protein n=1 Tax=Gymnopilus junonius TaxID=109634 RepID=A0A9P5TGV8_GYMJU|nr:hypothetical protein CPB84DRAFT_1853051 [Gymnopilus junonius]
MADVQESVTSVSSKSNKLLAFRTISNFLAFIQQQGYMDATSDKKGKELKLAVAFSIIASLETEVVAVGTKQEIDGVQVIVCSDLPDHFHQTLQQPSSLFQHLMLFVRNLHNDHPEYAGTYYQNGLPKVIPIMVPPALKKELDMESLTAYVDELCKVAPKKANIHYLLAQHIYVIKKIAGWFQHVSTPYMDSLEKASLNLLTENSPFPEAKVDDTADSEFLRMWPTRFAQDWREKYPIINDLAAQFVKDPTAQLYSRESLIEFHSLILDLLRHFRDSLAQLNMHSGSQPPDMCMKHIANIFDFDQSEESQSVKDENDPNDGSAKVTNGNLQQKLDQNAKINVQIVDPPMVDKQQLPWEQLFTPDSLYIPSVTLGFAEDNADILAYLQDSLGANLAGLWEGHWSVKMLLPVCHKLIKHFVDVGGNEFKTRGSHNTVTSCALPDWLPDNIIDSMNTFFGGWLRKEIIMHMKRGSTVQHSKSSGSSGGSSYDGSKHPDRVDLGIIGNEPNMKASVRNEDHW